MAGENRCECCGKFDSWDTLDYGTETIGNAVGEPEDHFWCEHKVGFGCRKWTSENLSPKMHKFLFADNPFEEAAK